VPPVDTTGPGLALPADQAAFDRAEIPLARTENWIRRAGQWISQTHGEVAEILSLPVGDPGKSWASRFSLGATFAAQSGFDVHLPPALPTAGEDVMYAAINNRMAQLSRMLARPVEISRDMAPGAHMHFVAGPPLRLVVNPAFLNPGPGGNTEEVRANMMVERLVDIMPTTEISAPLRPAYVSFVRRVRVDEGL
jgi:hypothetical protein